MAGGMSHLQARRYPLHFRLTDCVPAARWGLKNVGITSPDFSWLGPHRVPVNIVIGSPIKVGRAA